MQTPTADARLNELEARYAELEHLVQELSHVVYAQQRELDGLRRTAQELTTKLKAQDPGLVDAAQQDKPPHY